MAILCCECGVGLCGFVAESFFVFWVKVIEERG